MYVHSLSQSEQKLILKYNSLYLKPLFIVSTTDEDGFNSQNRYHHKVSLYWWGRGRRKSYNYFRKSFKNMLTPVIYYLQLILLPIFSILGSQVKESWDHRAGKEEITLPNPSFCRWKQACRAVSCVPGHTSIDNPG